MCHSVNIHPKLWQLTLPGILKMCLYFFFLLKNPNSIINSVYFFEQRPNMVLCTLWKTETSNITTASQLLCKSISQQNVLGLSDLKMMSIYLVFITVSFVRLLVGISAWD